MRQGRRLIATIGILGAFAASTAHAQDAKWTHYGVRPLAMGNAYVAVADDFNALFYNPAGLARLKEWHGELINPTVEYSKRTMSFIKDASKLTGGSSSDISSTLDLLAANSGKVQHLSLGLTPHLIFPHFGFGIGAAVDATMVFHRYPSVYLDVGPRVVAPFSVAFNFLEDRLSLGASVKYVMRAGINHEFSIQDIDAFTKKSGDDASTKKLDDFLEGGSGIGADVGMLFTPIKTMEPTLGVSITDFGGTPYSQKVASANNTPDPRLPSVNTGISVKPYQTERTYLLTAVDVHQANQPISFSKKLNLGVEYGLGSILKLQTGLHQGYLTAGFQFDVGLLKLRFVTYAEEMGETAGSIEDRRYAVQLKLLI